MAMGKPSPPPCADGVYLRHHKKRAMTPFVLIGILIAAIAFLGFLAWWSGEPYFVAMLALCGAIAAAIGIAAGKLP